MGLWCAPQRHQSRAVGRSQRDETLLRETARVVAELTAGEGVFDPQGRHTGIPRGSSQFIERFGERGLGQPAAGIDVDHRRRGAAHEGARFAGDPTLAVAVEVVEEVRHPDGPIAHEFRLNGGIGQYLCRSFVNSDPQQRGSAQLSEFVAANGGHQ